MPDSVDLRGAVNGSTELMVDAAMRAHGVALEAGRTARWVREIR